MECISQNSTDNQRREGVASSPEPECTARQLPLYVMIQLLFQETTTVNLQMKLLSQDKIRRR